MVLNVPRICEAIENFLILKEISSVSLPCLVLELVRGRVCFDALP